MNNVVNHTLLPDGTVLLVDPLDPEGQTLTGLSSRQVFQSETEEICEQYAGPLALADVLDFLD